MFAGKLDFGGTVAGAALKLRGCLVACVWLALGVSAGAQGNTPPDVPATTILNAPETIVPSGLGGSNVYRGSYAYAGNYLVESSTYDPVARKPVVTFTVRSAANHGVKYTLKPGAGFKGRADAAVDSDGSLLALKLRDTDNGQVRVSVHTLATGKLLFTLRQPDAKSGDSFGETVWFTSDRILVAAPGVDRPQANGGGLYVYNRTNGRLVGFAGSGVKNAYFGRTPSNQGTPYFQGSGKVAVFLHGDGVFRFAGDRLERISLPPQGTNKVTPRGALLSGNFLVVRTGEQKADGTGMQGRVIVYDALKRTVLYQLRASGMKGGFDFPSGIAVSGGRLFVHDASAAYPDSSRRGAIGAYALSTGKLTGVRSFAKATGVYQDGGSFALSGGLLWIKTTGDNQATRWLGVDPATLKQVRTLTPPAGSRFAGPAGAPQPLAGNRFGVITLRTEENAGMFLSPLSGARGMSSSVIIVAPGPGTTSTTAGVLVYDMASSRWTHRLTLESEPAASYAGYFFNGYDRLLIAGGGRAGCFAWRWPRGARRFCGLTRCCRCLRRR